MLTIDQLEWYALSLVYYMHVNRLTIALYLQGTGWNHWMRDCCMNSAHFIVAFRACLLENISKKELYKGTNRLHHM